MREIGEAADLGFWKALKGGRVSGAEEMGSHMEGRDFRSACTDSALPIQEGMAQLERAHKRILLVVDAERRLLGVVGDSDLRRARLNGQDFSAPLHTIMTRNPVVGRLGMTSAEMLALMRRTHCHELPVLDSAGRVIDLFLIEDVFDVQEPSPTLTAVVMAGGLGQRLRPLTEHTPKPLLPVGDQPILFTLLDQLLASHCERIYLALNYMAPAVIEAVEAVPRYRQAVRFLRENTMLGTIGALSLLPERPDRPFIVMNGDILARVPFEDILRTHQREGNALTVAVREQTQQLSYGIVTLEGTRVTGMREKPILSHFINAGIYVLAPSLLDRIPHQTRYDATTLIEDLLRQGLRVGSFPMRDYWIDIGLPDQLEQARRDYEGMFGAACSERPVGAGA
ncbi:nucleotidyltransferase family protein [Azospirillum argentinense]|nr:nucleotidyltransferase family protein [Azospirillum argentinense]